MPQRSDLPKAVAAALDLAARDGWLHVGLRQVAHAAKLPLPELYTRFPGKQALLDAYIAHVDRQMIAGYEVEAESEGGEVVEESVRERLFDLLMRRFDAMAPHKAALASVLRGLPADPLGALYRWPRLLHSMAWVLETAGVPADGVDGCLRTHALAGLYLRVMRTWLEDDTPDLSRTMADLDRRLHRAERLAAFCPRPPWRRAVQPASGPAPAGRAGAAPAAGEPGRG